VPGAYEIPLMAKQLILTKRWDAVVALGCVIRGETIHFEMIAQATSLNLQQISLETGVPITSGILMVENHEQALQRCGLMPKNPRSRSGREGEAPTALPAEGATCLPAGTAHAPINRGSEAAHAAVAVLKTLGELTQL
ncbi:MAG: 6,7-dimethyl-8-ribityllumazine synthase, partial [Deltaproteobacteria bacterium]|nr:6,7-dimethyl-8-ribityllumazine synthase [Deltaproteobacteria bacterium]